MKYKINYGDGVCVIPDEFFEIMNRASSVDIKVFLALCRASGKEIDASDLADAADCDESEVAQAVSFWRGSGLLFAESDGKRNAKKNKTAVRIAAADNEKNAGLPQSCVREDEFAAEDVKKETSEPKKKLMREDSLPSYSSDELASILEERTDTATLITECQNIMGKVFNVHEVNIIIGLVDYLGLEYEYILMLLAYCVRQGKKTLHYAEKTAFALYDSGVTEASMLSEELKRREEVAGIENKIRTLFGIGSRAFTAKEKKMIGAWVNDMRYPIEIIERAYEITADATGMASMPYANSVMERWKSEGLTTLEEIEKAQIKYEELNEKKNSGKKGCRASKNEQTPAGSTFDTDEFFDAAVKRSLGEDYKEN